MTSLGGILGQSIADAPLRKAFLRWQCRVRQTAMRDTDGRPDDGIMPAVFLPDEIEPMGNIITILNKAPAHSVIAEMAHMSAKTHDPAQRRDQALRFFSAAYYQKAGEFSDVLTATFPPQSPGAAAIRAADKVRLVFSASGQVFDLTCKVWRLAARNPLYQATLAHNRLFNPDIHPDTIVLGFEPDWQNSTSDPEFR